MGIISGTTDLMRQTPSVSFSEARESLREDVANRRDITVEISRCGIGSDADGIIVETPDGQELRTTPHSLKQLANHCDMVPHTAVNYLSEPMHKAGTPKHLRGEDTIKHGRAESDYAMLAGLLRLGQSHAKAANASKQFRMRIGNDNTLRAVLTDRYTAVDNIWFLNTLENVMPECRIHDWKSDGDTIFGKIFNYDDQIQRGDSAYNGMITVGNCEIGKRRVIVKGGILRWICTNGMTEWSKFSKVKNKVHKGKIDLGGMAYDIQHGISAIIPQFTKAVDAYCDLGGMISTVDMSKVFVAVGENLKLTKKSQNSQVAQAYAEWQEHEDGDKSLRGVIAGITRASQKFDAQTRFDMDDRAGEMMNMTDGQWRRILTRADSYDREEVLDAFGVSV